MTGKGVTLYLLAFDVLSLGLGATAAALMLRAGVVYTGITAHYIVVAIVFAYAAQINASFGVVCALVASLLLIVLSFLLRAYNARSYIISLYAFSLAAIPAGNFVLATTSGAKEGVASPAVDWGLKDAGAVTAAALILLSAAGAYALLNRSWRGVLLQHWGSLASRDVQDMRISSVFSLHRVALAGWPTAVIAAVLFVCAVLFGCFVPHGAYTVDFYQRTPFLALLFALIGHRRVSFLLLIVLIYGIASGVMQYTINRSNLTIPLDALLVFYGLMFFMIIYFQQKRLDD